MYTIQCVNCGQENQLENIDADYLATVMCSECGKLLKQNIARIIEEHVKPLWDFTCSKCDYKYVSETSHAACPSSYDEVGHITKEECGCINIGIPRQCVVLHEKDESTQVNADVVNHPKHYTSHPSGIECIQITRHMSFNVGNAMKYLWRVDEKGRAIEDLEKAIWYIQDEIAMRKKGKT